MKKLEAVPAAPGDTSRTPPLLAQVITWPFVWILGPLIIRANSWIAAKPNVAPTTLDALPENIATPMREIQTELEGEGLSLVACLDFGKRTENTLIWAMLLCNRERGDFASVSILDTRAKNYALTRSVVAFVSWSGEKELGVTNRDDAGLFVPQPGKRAVHFPQARDLRALYRIHRAWTQRDIADAPRTLPPPGEEIARFCEADRIALEHMAKHGALFLDAKTGLYRPTWKGAFQLAWKSIWPLKAILHARQRRDGAKLCGELGLAYPD